MPKVTKPQTEFTEDVWLQRVTVVHPTAEREPWWPYKPLIQYYVIHFDRKDGEYSYNKKHSLDSTSSTPYTREYTVRDMGEEVVAKAERIVAQLPEKWDKLVRKGRRTWQYKMLVRFADRIGWPESYREFDLETVDAANLASNPTEWLGIIRECGTWMVLPSEQPDMERRLSLIRNSPDGKFYYANKDGIKEITSLQFQNWIFGEVNRG